MGELDDTVPLAAAPPAASVDDRYRFVERLGEGGMGVVWAVHDRALDRTVALKLLHDRYLGAVDQERLAAEARAMARLSHRNVVAVYDVGERDGRTFVTMELVRGRDLAAWLETPRSWREVVTVFRAAGAGLAAAHAAGIVHRDVKPSNILIGDDGEVRVADFGVASTRAITNAETGPVATTAGVIGTPAYMSPERLRGEPADASGDQFAFAAALYEALHGARPFAGDTLAALRDAIEAGVPPPMRDVPRWLHDVVARGLATDPARRFPSIAAFVAALDGPRRSRRWLVVPGVVLAAGGGLAVALWPAGSGPPPAPELAALRALTSLGACAYSPAFADDDTVVFDLTRGDRVDLYRVAAAGGDPVQLTSSPATEWRATRGRRPGEIAYLIDDPAAKTSFIGFMDLWGRVETGRIGLGVSSVAVLGDALYYADPVAGFLRRRVGDRDEVIRKLDDSTVQLAVAPGPRLAWVATSVTVPTQLCWVGPDEPEPRCVPGVHEARPAWSPDGAFLFYSADDGIHRRDTRSDRDELVIGGADAAGGLATSPSGDLLAWSDCRPRGRIVDLASSPRALDLPADARDPVLGPAGLMAWRDRHGILVVNRPDGSHAQLGDRSLGDMSSASFNADGSRIAFVVSGAHHGIYVAGTSGGVMTQRVTDGVRDSTPTWLRDGRLAFTRSDDGATPSVYIVAATGGTPTRVLDLRETVGVRFSTNELLVGAPDHLAWWDPATGTERPGPTWSDGQPSIGAAVSPNGDWVAIATGANGRHLWRVPLATGVAELVTELSSQQTLTGDLTITDDGHLLAAPRSWSGELHVVPLRD